MRTLSTVALLVLALLAPGWAQSPPEQGGVHGPQAPSDQPSADEPPPEKGPNLDIPVWIGGASKQKLEAAIANWEAAFAKAKAKGAEAAGDVTAAIEALEAVRPLDDKCALPDYYLGIARQLTGEFDEAIARLKEAVSRKPDFHEAYVELGDACRWAGKERDAERNYDRALELAPDYTHGYYMRALLRVSHQEFQDARADVLAGLKLDADHGALQMLKKQLDLVLDGPDWKQKFETESRHYLVRTNVSQELCDEISRHAELIHRLYRGIFPGGDSRQKSPIVVFKDRQEYMANGGPRNAGGHFDPVFKQLFLFNYDKPSDTMLVLYHEGFHQFLDGIMPANAPQWFNEGLADYFGPSEYFKEQGKEGMRVRPNPWRLQTIKRMVKRDDFLPFERLINMSQAEMYEPSRAGNNYAQAWSMVYFFCEADDRAYFKYLKDYFKALRKGKSQREAYQAAFGKTDMAALTARWKEFVGDLKR